MGSEMCIRDRLHAFSSSSVTITSRSTTRCEQNKTASSSTALPSSSISSPSSCVVMPAGDLRANLLGSLGRRMTKRRKRWCYDEVGGRCFCDCPPRRLDPQNLQDLHDEGPDSQGREEHLRFMWQVAGLKMCACMICGGWEAGPLLPGMRRQWFGCRNKVTITEPFGALCEDCSCPSSDALIGLLALENFLDSQLAPGRY